MDQNREAGEQDRLRVHPSQRFSGASRVFELAEKARELRAEPTAEPGGHRQITLYRRAQVTQVLFAFEPGGELADHAAHGLVSIHVLEGRIAVRADGQEHDLREGSLLVLDPDVRHDVRAREKSAMLLTVLMDA